MQHCILLTLLHLSTSYCTFFFLFNSISYQKFPCIQIGNISKIQRSIDTRFQQLPHCFTLMFTTSCSSSNVSLPFFCIVCCYPSKNRVFLTILFAIPSINSLNNAMIVHQNFAQIPINRKLYNTHTNPSKWWCLRGVRGRSVYRIHNFVVVAVCLYYILFKNYFKSTSNLNDMNRLFYCFTHMINTLIKFLSSLLMNHSFQFPRFSFLFFFTSFLFIFQFVVVVAVVYYFQLHFSSDFAYFICNAIRLISIH